MTKRKIEKTDAKAEEIKSIRVGDHYDLTMEDGRQLRLFTGNAKQSIELVPNAERQGFRPANEMEKLDPTKPKVSALLCGMGVGEDKITTEYLFSAVLTPISNVPALQMCQVTSHTITPKLKDNIGEMDKILTNRENQMPKDNAGNKPEESEESTNQSQHQFKETNEPPNLSENLNEAMEDFMEDLDRKATKRRSVDHDLEERYKPKISNQHGRSSNTGSNTKSEEIRMSPGTP